MNEHGSFYAPAFGSSDVKIFYGEVPPAVRESNWQSHWPVVGCRVYKEGYLGLASFGYLRSWIQWDGNGVEEEEREEFSWPSFARFRDDTLPIARACGPRILECLGPIAKNDPSIKKAASRWTIVREHVVKRRIAFYWHDLTQHLMRDGGVAQARDRLAFEADMKGEAKRANH